MWAVSNFVIHSFRTNIKFFSFRIRYKRLNCRGRLVRDSSDPEAVTFKPTAQHSHAPNPTTVYVAKAVDSLKRKAQETTESTRNIIASVCKDMDVATSAAMGSRPALSKRAKRARTENIPVSPSNRADLIIPEKYTRSKDELFLLHDSGCTKLLWITEIGCWLFIIKTEEQNPEWHNTDGFPYYVIPDFVPSGFRAVRNISSVIRHSGNQSPDYVHTLMIFVFTLCTDFGNILDVLF